MLERATDVLRLEQRMHELDEALLRLIENRRQVAVSVASCARPASVNRYNFARRPSSETRSFQTRADTRTRLCRATKARVLRRVEKLMDDLEVVDDVHARGVPDARRILRPPVVVSDQRQP